MIKFYIIMFLIIPVYTQFYKPDIVNNKPTFKAYNSIDNNNIIVLERGLNNYLTILDLSQNYKAVFHSGDKPISVYVAPHTGAYRVISNLETFINIDVKNLMTVQEYTQSDIIPNNTISVDEYYMEIVLKSNCSYKDIVFSYENDKNLNIYRSTETYNDTKLSELYRNMKHCIDLSFIIKKNLQPTLYDLKYNNIISPGSLRKVGNYPYAANEFCNLCQETIDDITPSLYVFQTYLGPKGVNFDKYSKLTNNIDAEDTVIHWVDGGYIPHEDLNDEDIQYIVKRHRNNNSFMDTNHCLASLGIIKAIRNNFGITGIASKAKIMVYGVFDFNEIFNYVKPGDIVGINIGFNILNKTTKESIDYPVSEPAYMKYRIKKLLNLGVIVIAAAGNGNHNMSSDVFKDTYVKDLILVGSVNVDNSKTDFSNYNHPNLIISTWGYNLMTTGYGDLYYNQFKNSNYTTIFSGTSASTPIVTGIVASLQSYVKKNFNKFLTAADAIKIIENNTVKTPTMGYIPDMVTMLNHIKSKYFYNRYLLFSHSP